MSFVTQKSACKCLDRILDNKIEHCSHFSVFCYNSFSLQSIWNIFCQIKRNKPEVTYYLYNGKGLKKCFFFCEIIEILTSRHGSYSHIAKLWY